METLMQMLYNACFAMSSCGSIFCHQIATLGSDYDKGIFTIRFWFVLPIISSL